MSLLHPCTQNFWMFFITFTTCRVYHFRTYQYLRIFGTRSVFLQARGCQEAIRWGEGILQIKGSHFHQSEYRHARCAARNTERCSGPSLPTDGARETPIKCPIKLERKKVPWKTHGTFEVSYENRLRLVVRIWIARTGSRSVVLTATKVRVLRIEEARRRRILAVAKTVVTLGRTARRLGQND